MSENKHGIDKGLIRDLANILNETDLTEIEVEQEDVRIRVSRVSATQYVQALPHRLPPLPRLPQPHRQFLPHATTRMPSMRPWSAPSTFRRHLVRAPSWKSAPP